ncbi:MAG: leucine--tRNA ligase [Candidatus Pacearchaeota archaeon]
MEEANFKQIEEKWQKKWEEEKIFEAKEDYSKKKFYVLEMFPYPSATGLHMGHAFNFVIGDIYARFKKMQGFNVLHPMGFDALGLPAENAAIKEGIDPATYTQNSIKNFIKQQKKLGLSYDWSRVIDTSQPEYYKWDQWIFLQMYKRGLVYKKKAAVNWCPSCQTIIANEQAQGGVCERCGNKIEIRHMEQWFFKITNYADRLLEGHKNLNWPEKTIAMQKNWIGKSLGTEIDFEINGEKWPIFTTRPDTIFGVTFMVISAQHPRLMELVTKKQKKEVEKFLEKIGSVSEKELEELEKIGVFTGSYAINPANGEKVPVYVGNFVVADYGCGMVMAVPAHDQRDFEFAKKYNIPIKQVIEGKITETRAWTGEGKLINSAQFNGINSEEAKERITQWLIEKGVARRVVNYKLRDWSVARQRYWGTPIPLIHCEKCGVVPVPEKDLPVVLPKNVKFGKGNPLETNKEWLKVKCPSCGKEAKREPNTMDTFVNSSWYFLRFCDPNNDKEIFSKEKVKYWMPVDLYIGGAEHACMHLIYERFYTMFLHDIGLIDFEEATPRLFHQGMINDEKGEKMSKSKGNVVEPLEVIDKYGTDTTRFYLISEASPDKGFNWTEKGIQGALRFTKSVIKIFDKIKIGKTEKTFEKEVNVAIKKITEYIENIDYRKATIELRRIFDILEKQKEVSKETLENILKLLSPFCPHIAEELWEKLGNKPFISTAEWPKVKEIREIKREEDLNKKIISEIKPILEKFPEKKKIYLYVLPFELEKINKEKLEKEFKREVSVFSVKDKDKYDPQNKSKKALPGKPSFWIE